MRVMGTGTAVMLVALCAATSAMAQSTQLAYATAPRNDFVVFFDQDTTMLSLTALKTVRMAASEAGPAQTVRLSGSPERTAAVKAELISDGIPAGMIEVRKGASEPLPAAPGVTNSPADRRVEIKF